MIIFNDAAVGSNGGPDNPDSKENASKGIEFYANNEEFHQRLQRYITLLRDADQIYRDLSSISKSIPDSNASPEIKEAKQRECGNLLTTFENVIHRKEYVELVRIFDEYDEIATRFQNKDLTPEGSIKLGQERANVGIEFEDKEGFAAALINFDLAEAHKSIIDDAIAFIRRHNGQEALPPPSTAAEPKPSGNTPTPDHTNHMAATGNANTRGGRGTTHATNGEDTSQTTEGTINDIPNTADAKGSSGFVTMRCTVVQIMVAVGIMVIL
ncbi:hypothetical protein, conserved [Babesia ovata]|uniref:Uncharacterized protein n=1 Tax=Babesia ovata TaxID=189622 RepID=A0A2H6KF67_9APIC|nr:uncharacterized protein BOVATA_031340 [Babesia ovata]GBE61641.1 hypothetical protein, conserved [Babesia ovata]